MSGLFFLEFRVSYEEVSELILTAFLTIKKPAPMRLAFASTLQLLLLTFAVAAIPAEIAPACVLELAVAFGADADHVGHDGAGYGFLM
jgi:hypothetical protein